MNNHVADAIYKIHVGDQVIEATFNHPFWVDGKGWTFVKDLQVGDLFVQSDGNKIKVDSIEFEQKQVTVYNMTVDDFHTYFVSDLGIWVHNTKCSIKRSEEATKLGEHTVYTLRDPITDEVKYVGRTKNPVSRKAAHKLAEDKSGLVFSPEHSGLSYSQARGVEQMLFDKNGGLGILLNRINPISTKNPNRNTYLKQAMNLLN